MRSAYSTNIKERHDHSTAIVDRPGRLVVQAEQSLAIHLASMTGLMRTLLAKVPLAEIREGDIFCANDPYVAGGTHLPDVNLAMPVFTGAPARLRLQHRAPRRHRRHGARKYGWRDD